MDTKRKLDDYLRLDVPVGGTYTPLTEHEAKVAEVIYRQLMNIERSMPLESYPPLGQIGSGDEYYLCFTWSREGWRTDYRASEWSSGYNEVGRGRTLEEAMLDASDEHLSDEWDAETMSWRKGE